MPRSVLLNLLRSIGVSVAAVAHSTLALSAPISAQTLRSGPWQFGLHGAAKSLPIGLAFKRGITGTVVTFNGDGTMRMDIPCRNEEFLRSIGGEFHLEGVWELSSVSELRLTLQFRGEGKVENYSASIEDDELLLVGPTSTKRLGRFAGDVNATCRYE